MADKYYVWSPIHDSKGVHEVGEQVSKSDLDISDADWDYLIAAGTLRTRPYPTDDDGNVVVNTSPTQHRLAQLTAAGEEAYVAEASAAEEGEVQEPPAT